MIMIDFDTKLISLNRKINSYKTKYVLVKNELKSYKYLIQVILDVKTILQKMVLKII